MNVKQQARFSELVSAIEEQVAVLGQRPLMGQRRPIVQTDAFVMSQGGTELKLLQRALEDSLEAVRNAVKLQSVDGDGERGQSYRVNETLSSSLLRLKDRIALFNPKAETDGPSAAGPAMDSSGECSKGTAAQGNSDNIQSTKKKVSVVLPTVEPEPSSVDARISEILASVGEAVWLEGEKEAQREGERLSPAVEILRNEFSWAEGNEDGQAGQDAGVLQSPLASPNFAAGPSIARRSPAARAPGDYETVFDFGLNGSGSKSQSDAKRKPQAKRGKKGRAKRERRAAKSRSKRRDLTRSRRSTNSTSRPSMPKDPILRLQMQIEAARKAASGWRQRTEKLQVSLRKGQSGGSPLKPSRAIVLRD